MIQLSHFQVFIKCKNTDLKEYMQPHVQCTIVSNSQNMEKT